MKNTIAGLIVALMLIAPSFSYAQTATTTQTTYQQTLIQLINLLMVQVQGLQAQLAVLQDKQNTLADDVKSVKESTTKATGAAEDNTVTVPKPVPFDVTEDYYSDGNIYVQTTQPINTNEVSVEKFHERPVVRIIVDLVTSSQSGSKFNYVFSAPDNFDTKAVYSLGVLREGHSFHKQDPDDGDSNDEDIVLEVR